MAVISPERQAAEKVLLEITRDYRVQNEQIFDALDDYRSILTGDLKHRRSYQAQVNQLEKKAIDQKKKELALRKQMADIERSIEVSTMKHNKTLAKLGVDTIQNADELDKAVELLTAALDAEPLEGRKIEMREALGDLQAQQEAMVGTQKELVITLEGLTKVEKEYAAATALTVKMFETTKDKIKAWVMGFATGGALWTATKDLYGSVVKMGQSGVIFEHNVTSMSDAMQKLTTEPIKLGLTPKEYFDLIQANRQAINSIGGSQKAFEDIGKIVNQDETALKNFSPTMAQLSLHTGGAAESSRFLTEQMTMLAKAGIKPTLAAIDKTLPAFVSLKNTLGVTDKEYTQLMNDMVEDEGVRAQLRAAASEKEREQILKTTMNLIATNAALGMTKENAIAAAKNLNKIAGEKAVDRFAKAAKFQALAGAMGLDRQMAAQAAAYMRSPIANAQFKESYQKARNAIGGEAGRVQATGGGQEIAVQGLLEATGMEELGAQSAEASTRTAVATEASKSVLDNINKQQTEDNKVFTSMASGINTIGQGMALLSNPIAQLAIGVVGLGASVLSGAFGGTFAGVKAAGGLGGKGMGGVDFDVGDAKGGGKAGKVAKLAKFGKIGGAVLGAGLAAYEGYEIYKETGKKGKAIGTGVGGAGGAWGGAAAGAALGAFGGPFAPITVPAGALIGGAVGAYAGGKGGGLLGGMFDKDEKKTTEEKTDEASTSLTQVEMHTEKSADTLADIADTSKKQLELQKQVLTAIVTGNDSSATNIDVAKRLSDLRSKSASYNYF